MRSEIHIPELQGPAFHRHRQLPDTEENRRSASKTSDRTHDQILSPGIDESPVIIIRDVNPWERRQLLLDIKLLPGCHKEARQKRHIVGLGPGPPALLAQDLMIEAYDVMGPNLSDVHFPRERQKIVPSRSSIIGNGGLSPIDPADKNFEHAHEGLAVVLRGALFKMLTLGP